MPHRRHGFCLPARERPGRQAKTLLTTYQRSGGKNAALPPHSQDKGAQCLGDLGRAAQLEKGQKDGTQGVPARALPVALWHAASTGLDLWLAAVAYGAANVWVLLTDEEAPQYVEALREQMAVAQTILTGLGYQGTHFRLLQVRDARDLAALDRDLQAAAAQAPARHAGFAVQSDKRATLELALDHLISHAPKPSQAPIALPASGLPLGGLAINKDTCTLCLSCVNACPASALADNKQAPQLRFIEKNCVQCGLCVKTCPEKALKLVPQLQSGIPAQGACGAQRDATLCLRALRQTLWHAQGHRRPCWANWRATACSRAPRWSASKCAATAASSTSIRPTLKSKSRISNHDAIARTPMPAARSTKKPPVPSCMACRPNFSMRRPHLNCLANLRGGRHRGPGAPAAFWRSPGARWWGWRVSWTIDAIAQECNHLFGGVGKPEVYLYGSHYLSGFLNEKPLARLRTELTSLGLGRDDAMSDTEDHIAYLSEVMRYLIAGDDVAVANLARQQTFFADHLQPWVGPVRCHSQHPKARFYAAVAELTRAFVSVEAQGFDMLA